MTAVLWRHGNLRDKAWYVFERTVYRGFWPLRIPAQRCSNVSIFVTMRQYTGRANAAMRDQKNLFVTRYRLCRLFYEHHIAYIIIFMAYNVATLVSDHALYWPYSETA